MQTDSGNDTDREYRSQFLQFSGYFPLNTCNILFHTMQVTAGLLFSLAIRHDKLTQHNFFFFFIRTVLCPDLKGLYVMEVSISSAVQSDINKVDQSFA